MGKKKIYEKPEGRRITKEGFFIGITVFIIIILMFGILQNLNDILFLPGTVSINGTIISCQMMRLRVGSSYCGATISFETQSGEHIIFYEAAGDSKKGDTVVVKYHPANPLGARIDTLLYNLTIVGIGLGLLLIDMCIFLCWKRHKAREYAQRSNNKTYGI